MTFRLRIPSLLGALTLIAAACGDDSGDAEAASATPDTTAAVEATTSPTAAPATTAPSFPATTAAPGPSDSCDAVSLELDVSALPELAGGHHYEGWAIIEGVAATTGKFDVVDGSAFWLDGSPAPCFNTDGLEVASALVITIEPPGDTDTVPSDTHFLAGEVAESAATLTIDHPAALGTDFSDAAGTFLLATPTDGNGTNELSGIWFLEIPSPSKPSLVLPPLPGGWAYEGWAIIDGVPVTSGTFLTADGFDDFDGYSGDQGGPPFPGEDFLVDAPDGVTFPTDLTGGTIVVSVEPSPDDSPEPFVLKPLLGTAGDPATDHESYLLGNNATEFPFATAVIG